MKLNKGYSLYRYEIARFLNLTEKQLYRFLKRKEIKIASGIVPPCDLDRIEAAYFGEKSVAEDSNEDNKREDMPQRG